ncbi:MAG: hypothetical protein ACHQ50_06335 [Fimbriimonadales bacterium]
MATVIELAKGGVSAAREALHANFDPADDFRLAEAIIELDGLAGLDWLILHSTGHLVPDNSSEFHWWVGNLTRDCGEETVSAWLARESASRPEVAEFARLLALWEAQPRPSRVAPVALTYEELREQWHRPGSPRGSTISWVRSASEDDLAKAWRALETEEDPEWLRRLAQGLKRKPRRCDLLKLIDRAQEWNDERNPFAWALEQVVGPRVRRLGFDLIESGWIVNGIGVLRRNAVPGDEPAFLRAVAKLTHEDDIHGAGIDLRGLGNELDTRDIRIWVYETTPCSLCREGAVKRLIESGRAPEELLRECLLDCDDYTRELATKALA